MWTATFTDGGKGVGKLEAVFNDGQVDEFRFTVSVDMERVKDLVPLAEKIKIAHAEHVAEQQKPAPWADSLAGFVAALNEGK